MLIEDVAFGGAGVGRVDGMAVFVPYTIPGERVRARVVRRKKSFAEGEMVALLEAAPTRAVAPCVYFGQCGGCAYQHMEYPEQLRVKQAQVEQTLKRIGKFESVPMAPMEGSPEPLGYRNRITVHREGRVTGYYTAGGRGLIDVERCEIASALVNDQLRRLRRSQGRDGRFTLSEKIGGPGFAQVNRKAAEILARLVEEFCPASGALLVDAYCGSGFFLKKLGDRFERSVGIEWSEASLKKAREGAGGNEKYLAGDVARLLPGALEGADPEKTFLILDPPSKGLEKSVLRAVLDHTPARVAYVSCNPSTLARDLAALKDAYAIEKVTPVDMFAQTAEIEVVTTLQLSS